MSLIPDFQFEIVLVNDGNKLDILLNVDGLSDSTTDDDRKSLTSAVFDDDRFKELEGVADTGSMTRVFIHQTVASRLSYLIHIGYLKQIYGYPNSSWTFLTQQYQKDMKERKMNSYRAERSVELG
jgi:hypothetical protein